MIASAVQWLSEVLALPNVGLSTVFLISMLSATLLPLGSEPAVFAVIKINPAMFWPAIFVATVGNTLGGAIGYWMGYGAHQVFASERESRGFGWLQRFGARTLLLAWVPVIGDPICVLAGWLRIPFWPSVFYMALGKFLRYVMIVGGLLFIPDGFWRQILHWL
jgi:membrane protein YqaA with SNARE-associated domain